MPIELSIAMYLLWMQLGLAFMAPMLVAVFSTVGIIWMAQYIGNAQKRWIEGIQTRVDVTASMLGSMKVGCFQKLIVTILMSLLRVLKCLVSQTGLLLSFSSCE